MQNFEEVRPSLIVFDLDGVSRDCNSRLKAHLDMGAYQDGDFHRYRESLKRYSESDCSSDPCIPEGILLMRGMISAFGADRIVILTANDCCAREGTLCWIRTTLFSDFRDEDLLMRPDSIRNAEGRFDISSEPYLNSATFKKDVLEALCKEYRILAVVDDHPEIVAVAKAMGLYVIQPHAPGEGIVIAGDTLSAKWSEK